MNGWSDYSNKIRKNITPIGDGNSGYTSLQELTEFRKIRKNITPIGDGNTDSASLLVSSSCK